MRVLVTRPLPAAETTARRLEAAGHEAILLPLMQATRFTVAAKAALEMPHAAIALTSAEAVRVLAAFREDLAKDLADPCFCVGEATARAAEELGFADIRIGGGTGEALAGLIASTIDTLTQQPVLYLTGTPRSDGLEHMLQQHGINHRVVECYRMDPIAHPPGILQDAMRPGPFDAVLLYSRETARRLASLLSDAGLAAPSFASRYLCLSPAIAEALPHNVRLEIAARPDEESLFSLL
ncbi:MULTISPECIES: uroporphyrinogen-III synthase [unclassified Ensifer]|uniref:uroporphyrinogen-III synthase n=1 Tax=unclassified Ensifer TaxID=2633371 RepID=UPI0008132BB3|nr:MULTISPECIES: uroporphyrinogen-III synthase [unclassified Ensifer]OCP11060.1 uroporphyrinogen III synthase [Ensifer sp. LC14]OCP12768.1 uroporphyrinogen III synthase [Ensifer sp. LC13]OCP13385.1 uroporphyrinogen III synthase [Ensifer sp. LC11]OCP34211.1 uroporphyrinogen III synthase [Ensifer sp. LC499]